MCVIGYSPVSTALGSVASSWRVRDSPIVMRKLKTSIFSDAKTVFQLSVTHRTGRENKASLSTLFLIAVGKLVRLSGY
jgi:hypothetical protein